MDVIARIEELMKARGWSVYELARRSGLPQSTLSNLFNRRNLPTISTLEQVCGTLGIPLAEFFAGAETPPEEELTRELLRLWKPLNPAQKLALVELLRSMRCPAETCPVSAFPNAKKGTDRSVPFLYFMLFCRAAAYGSFVSAPLASSRRMMQTPIFTNISLSPGSFAKGFIQPRRGTSR